MYDALKSEAGDHLNFFRVYKGALMDGVVVDWWKVFGSDGADSHWKNRLDEAEHDAIRESFSDAIRESGEERNYSEVWEEIREFRNTNVAHLDFNQEDRAQRYPSLMPLRVSAEIVYMRVFEKLQEHGMSEGFPAPENMR